LIGAAGVAGCWAGALPAETSIKAAANPSAPTAGLQ
jgi:hypothetical protein